MFMDELSHQKALNEVEGRLGMYEQGYVSSGAHGELLARYQRLQEYVADRDLYVKGLVEQLAENDCTLGNLQGDMVVLQKELKETKEKLWKREDTIETLQAHVAYEANAFDLLQVQCQKLREKKDKWKKRAKGK